MNRINLTANTFPCTRIALLPQKFSILKIFFPKCSCKTHQFFIIPLKERIISEKFFLLSIDFKKLYASVDISITLDTMHVHKSTSIYNLPNQAHKSSKNVPRIFKYLNQIQSLVIK